MSTMCRCTVCGKEFYPALNHSYRTIEGKQCSYTCYRKAGGDSGVYGKGLSDEDRRLLYPVRKKTKE